MSYNLVALDIDGTIRSEQYPLSERTRRAIDRAMEAGAVVTLATGRTYQSALIATGDLNLISPIASCQGAKITDPITEEVLWHRPLTPDMVREALDALAPWGLKVLAFHNDQVYTSQTMPRIESHGQQAQVRIEVDGDVKEIPADELTRLVATGSHDDIRRLEEELKERFDSELYVTRSLPHYCEILHPEGGKDKALAWLCDHFNTNRESVVAFGNGYNDPQMLRWAGLGVAIGGAVPQALAAADRIAPPIEQDGAAQVLEELLDNGLIG